jgi:hypothetical protein
MENLWFSVSIFPQTNSLNPATKKNLCWWTVRYSHTKRLGFGLVSTHPVDWPRNEDINLGNPIHRIELWIRWKIHVLWQTQKALAHICAVTAIPWCCFVDTLKKKTVEKREPSSSQTWQATDQFSLGKSCSFNPQRWVMVVHDTNYVGPCKIVKTIIHNIYIYRCHVYITYMYIYIYGYICVLTCLTCYVYIYTYVKQIWNPIPSCSCSPHPCAKTSQFPVRGSSHWMSLLGKHSWQQ